VDAPARLPLAPARGLPDRVRDVLALLDGAARVLPKDVDISFVATLAGLAAGVGSFLAFVSGHDPKEWALIGGRWGALAGLVYLVVALAMN